MQQCRRYLEQRHIDLDNGRSCLALEREYWQALEVMACEDGWNNWREIFYMRLLLMSLEDIPLASFVRRSISKFCLRSMTGEADSLKNRLTQYRYRVTTR